jgi:hypothetical protein
VFWKWQIIQYNGLLSDRKVYVMLSGVNWNQKVSVTSHTKHIDILYEKLERLSRHM